MPQREKPPAPMVTLTDGALRPTTAADAEALAQHADGTDFDLVKRTRRSNRQLRLYWKALHMAVEATAVRPRAEHLHDDLKLACGFIRKAINRDTQEVIVIPDSVALEAMDADEFRAYFDAAMAKLAGWVGFDPLGFAEAEE